MIYLNRLSFLRLNLTFRHLLFLKYSNYYYFNLYFSFLCKHRLHFDCQTNKNFLVSNFYFFWNYYYKAYYFINDFDQFINLLCFLLALTVHPTHYYSHFVIDFIRHWIVIFLLMLFNSFFTYYFFSCFFSFSMKYLLIYFLHFSLSNYHKHYLYYFNSHLLLTSSPSLIGLIKRFICFNQIFDPHLSFFTFLPFVFKINNIL